LKEIDELDLMRLVRKTIHYSEEKRMAKTCQETSVKNYENRSFKQNGTKEKSCGRQNAGYEEIKI